MARTRSQEDWERTRPVQEKCLWVPRLTRLSAQEGVKYLKNENLSIIENTKSFKGLKFYKCIFALYQQTWIFENPNSFYLGIERNIF